MSEKGDSIDKSMKTDSEDLEIFDDCRAEMENLLTNGDEKTDNEVQKNPGQLGSKKQGFQKTLKNKSTQSIISKNGASAVEKQKTNLTESQSDKANKNELDVQVIPVEKQKTSLTESQSDKSNKEELDVQEIPVEQKIGKANPLHQIHQQEAEEEIEEVEKDVKCTCRKHCESPDLSMRDPELIFRLKSGDSQCFLQVHFTSFSTSSISSSASCWWIGFIFPIFCSTGDWLTPKSFLLDISS
jgi:hypothetical protein